MKIVVILLSLCCGFLGCRASIEPPTVESCFVFLDKSLDSSSTLTSAKLLAEVQEYALSKGIDVSASTSISDTLYLAAYSRYHKRVYQHHSSFQATIQDLIEHIQQHQKVLFTFKNKSTNTIQATLLCNVRSTGFVSVSGKAMTNYDLQLMNLHGQCEWVPLSWLDNQKELHTFYIR